jgi:hypothetical protein
MIASAGRKQYFKKNCYILFFRIADAYTCKLSIADSG